MKSYERKKKMPDYERFSRIFISRAVDGMKYPEELHDEEREFFEEILDEAHKEGIFYQSKTCDVCGATYKRSEGQEDEMSEFVHISATGGYHSKHIGDMTTSSCDMCEECFAKVVGPYTRNECHYSMGQLPKGWPSFSEERQRTFINITLEEREAGRNCDPEHIMEIMEHAENDNPEWFSANFRNMLHRAVEEVDFHNGAMTAEEAKDRLREFLSEHMDKTGTLGKTDSRLAHASKLEEEDHDGEY